MVWWEAPPPQSGVRASEREVDQEGELGRSAQGEGGGAWETLTQREGGWVATMWPCTCYSQIRFWWSSNFGELSAQLLQVLHYWPNRSDFFVSITHSKCLIYHKLLGVADLHSYSLSKLPVNVAPQPPRLFSRMEVYIAVSWVWFCNIVHLSQHFSSFSTALLATCLQERIFLSAWKPCKCISWS